MPTIPYKLKDGTKVKGVTTIIGGNLGWNKEALKYWAWFEGMEGRDYKKSTQGACDSGTIAHYMVECDIKKIKLDLAKEFPAATKEPLEAAGLAYDSFVDWKKQHHFKVVKTEVHLVSEIFGYGLTPDCIAEVDDALSLFDWKTGKDVYADHIIQLVAYKHGWEENFPDLPLIGGYHLLRIPKKEGTSWHHHHWGYADLEKCWPAFLHLLEIDSLKKPIENLL